MIIAQISDTHLTLDTPDADQRISDFEAVIADINSLDPAPDVIVHTGDIVHNGLREEYAKAVEIISRSKFPLYALVGNKDDRTEMKSAFSDQGYINRNSEFVDYAVDDGPVRMIMLDTLCIGSNKGDFCEKRADKFNNMIENDIIKPIAVFTHHPPFEVSVGPEPLHFDDPAAMQRLRRTLQNSGRVKGIFSGHVHRATTGQIDGIPTSVMSAVATPLRWDTYPDAMKTRPVYQIHRFDEEGAFSSETRIVSD